MRNKFLLFFLCVLIFSSVINAGAQSSSRLAHQHLTKSMEHLINGEFYEAIASIENALRLDPNSAIFYIMRARANYELKEYEKAIADCSLAIRLDRNSSNGYVIRGNTYNQLGEYSRAISDFEAALRINPHLEEARVNIEIAKLHLAGG